jgi:hypothetical protein
LALNPTTDVLEAMLRIRSAEPALVKWLESRLNEHKTALVALPDAAEFKTAQGRAQEVSQILAYFQQADELLTTLRRASGHR